MSADAVSVAGAMLCLAAGLSLATGAPLILGAVLFSVGAGCDALDGPIARHSQRGATRSGAAIDSVGDKVGEAALFLGLFVRLEGDLVTELLVASFALGFITSGVKDAAEKHQLNVSWHGARYFGRAGRATLLSGTLLTAALAVNPSDYFTAGLAVLTLFNASTMVWRIFKVARQMSREAGAERTLRTLEHHNLAAFHASALPNGNSANGGQIERSSEATGTSVSDG